MQLRIIVYSNANLRVGSFDRCGLDFAIANKFVLSFSNLVHFPLDDWGCVTMLDIPFITAPVGKSLSLSVLSTNGETIKNLNHSWNWRCTQSTDLFFVLFIGYWYRHPSRLKAFLSPQSFLSFASQTNFAFNRRLFRPTKITENLRFICVLGKKPDKCTNKWNNTKNGEQIDEFSTPLFSTWKRLKKLLCISTAYLYSSTLDLTVIEMN